MAMAREMREKHEDECVDTGYSFLYVLQLLFSRVISFRVSFGIVVFFSPTYPYLFVHGYIFTLGRYRIDMGVFLPLWQRV